MAGSISLSLSQQFDELGEPLNGGLLYFFAAGTTTPQSAYQDVALTLPYPNPIVLDSAGRVPAFYLADGQIKIRLASAVGVTQVAADNLLVIGASSGAGSPPTVDATTILDTGDIKIRYGTGVLTGFVRLNGRTIGSATSGASERANADCQDLFEYLWTADANLTVSTGRGASANADWVANKTITLPDGRGRTIYALDDMGNSAAGRLTATYFGKVSGATGIVLGGVGGSQTRTMVSSDLVAHSHTLTDPGHFHSDFVGRDGTAGGSSANSMNGTSTSGGGASGSASGTTFRLETKTTGITMANSGGGNPYEIASPGILMTVYCKL